jgi:RHS repeat-associated protein
VFALSSPKCRSPGTGWGPEAQADTKAFTYDNAGNSTKLINNSTTSTYSPNALNEYSSIINGATQYNLTYDSNGGLTDYDGVLPTYNADNQLQSITNGTLTTTLGYDPLGRCVTQTTGGVTTYLKYDAWSPIIKWNSSSGVIETYIHGVGSDEHLCTTPSGSSSYYFCQEPNGNVIALTNSSGSFFEFYQYDLFGSPFIFEENKTQLSASQVGNLFMFQGRPYFSAYGTYNFRHRAYSATLGRFLQADPSGFAGGNNLYAFGGNNPVTGTDPMGLTEQRIDGVFNLITVDASVGIDVPEDPQFDSPVAVAGGNATVSVPGGKGYLPPWTVMGKRPTSVPPAPPAPPPAPPVPSPLPPPSSNSQTKTEIDPIDSTFLGLFLIGMGIVEGETNIPEGEPTIEQGLQMIEEGIAAESEVMATVTHFTSAEGAVAIGDGGFLRAGSFLTTDNLSGLSASEVESALEIDVGKGAFSTTFQTPASNLGPAFNGPLTSGGATQFQIINPARVTTFVPTP